MKNTPSGSAVIRAAVVYVAVAIWFGFAVACCRGEDYAASESGIWQLAWRDGRPEWLKLSKEGDRVILHRIGTPLPPVPPGDDDDDDDDTPQPPGSLAERVKAAVLATNDKTNAGYLRDLYTIGVAMMDANAPTLNVVTILKLGEARILDTADERRLWGAYLTITTKVYGSNPIRSQAIRDIRAGIELATQGPSRIYYLRKGE